MYNLCIIYVFLFHFFLFIFISIYVLLNVLWFRLIPSRYLFFILFLFNVYLKNLFLWQLFFV